MPGVSRMGLASYLWRTKLILNYENCYEKFCLIGYEISPFPIENEFLGETKSVVGIYNE